MIYVLIIFNNRRYKVQIVRFVREIVAFITSYKYNLFNNIKLIYKINSGNNAKYYANQLFTELKLINSKVYKACLEGFLQVP